MQRARSGGWQLLTAVVVLGAVRPAGAQPPDNLARQAEIRVELAWLADPLVCPYYPCARASSANLLVGGLIPDENTRARTLELARRNCALPVVDRLQVYPGLSAPRVQVAAEKLQRAARVTVQAEFPESGPDLNIACSGPGQITIAGKIASAEQKLQVSQRLRRLPGCAGVVNLLEVDGSGVGNPSPPMPAPQALAAPAPAPVQTRWLPAPGSLPAPEGPGPALPGPVVKGGQEPEAIVLPLLPPVEVASKSKAPAPQRVVLGPTLKPDLDIPAPPAMKMKPDLDIPAPPTMKMDNGWKPVPLSPPPAPQRQQTSVSARPALPIPTELEPVAPASAPAALPLPAPVPVPAAPISPPPLPLPAPVPVPDTPVSPPSSALPVEAQVTTLPASAAAQPAAVPEAPVAVPPAAPLPAQASVPPAPSQAAPVTAETPVTLSPPEPEYQSVLRVTPAELQVQLRDRIKDACPEAKEVTVAFTSGLGILVRLQVAVPSACDHLVSRVQALPELSPFLVDIEVRKVP